VICNNQGEERFIRACRFLFGVPFLVLPTLVHGQSEPAVGQTNSLAPDFSINPPAVSGINGKISYEGGSINSDEGHIFDGSISLPISHQFGFQADGLYGRISDVDYYGGAGHLFWRNPNVGLVGLTGGYLSRSGADTFQAGLEGQYYFKRVTLGFFGGLGSIDYATSVPFIATNPNRFVGRLSADYYPLNDLRLGVGYTTAFENNLIQGNIEYQTPINGLALTAEVAVGDFGYDHYLFGLRYYFGGKKSLIERQRRDDPPSLMKQVLHDLGVYDAKFSRRANEYQPPPTTPTEPEPPTPEPPTPFPEPPGPPPVPPGPPH